MPVLPSRLYYKTQGDWVYGRVRNGWQTHADMTGRGTTSTISIVTIEVALKRRLD